MKKIVAGGAAAIALATSAALLTQVTAPAATAALAQNTESVVTQAMGETLAVLQAEEEARLAAEAEAARLAAEAARIAAEEEAARQAAANRPTNDYGIADSAYTGSYYNASSESTRKCIVRKESGGNYGIVSSNGSYHGAYQFSRSTGDVAAQRMGRADLVGTPASRWTRAEQDQAFWTMWNHGAGRGHWPTANGC